ncbi:hypothetical protein E7V67_012700 [[Empedobacter] haloabium]|uniref:Uncharacterized protein n=1 Tax=[Empedobacter] haloabium TaxID=592317 RepID=A0ABZ1UTI2_9BURK
MLARFKPLFITVAAFASCWAGVIWHRRASNREPGTGDLVARLLVLPLALLLADPVQAALLAPDEPPVLLRAAASAQLADSADTVKRPAPGVLDGLVADLLASTRCEPSDIAALAADTDHRGNRTMELMDLVSNRFKQLDASADLASVGMACGSSGAATYLTALVLARQDVTERGAPVLCIGNLDPYRRDAALLAPGTEV